MCAQCENWMYSQTLQHMADTGAHLEVALRLTRDCVVQNAVSDQQVNHESDEVTMQLIRDLTASVDVVANRMREVNPGALAALVAMIDTSPL